MFKPALPSGFAGIRRLVVTFLVVALTPLPAFAGSLRDSIKAEAEKAAQTAPAPALKPNPYKMPALALIGGGAVVMILGLTQEKGVEVSGTGLNARVSEKGSSKTALTILGASAMAGGGFVYWMGEQKRRPSITPGFRVWPTGAALSSVVRF